MNILAVASERKFFVSTLFHG